MKLFKYFFERIYHHDKLPHDIELTTSDIYLNSLGFVFGKKEEFMAVKHR